MVSTGDHLQGSETLAVDKRVRQFCILQWGLAKVGNGSFAALRAIQQPTKTSQSERPLSSLSEQCGLPVAALDHLS